MLVGKHISSRYKILQLIGGGGMSNVYLAHDIILNRDVAIKILRYDFSNEEELHRRFQREALSATSLTHPNIVSIYDVGEDGDMHYIVMEYIKGKTLKQYIQEFSPLSPARSVHIMKQLTSAMSQAHENGIIHRDIKPQNILMDEEGNVKITDFGIATSLGATSYTQTNSVIGTVHYLSPEQARGGIASMKSDIYALGIVLYELLTGELPFSGESAVSIALKHLQSETPSVREFDASIPQSIENIVLKATSKDMRHRYASTEEMEADLDTCLSVKRKDEPKFMTPLDNDATKLIPIIKDPTPVRPSIPANNEPTVKIEPQKAEPISSPQQKKKKKKWPIFVGIFAALVVIGIVLAFVLTPNKIEVPDVKNLPISDAIQKLENAGFIIGEQVERNSEEIELGSVIDMKPEANSMHVKGTKIDLVVSIGEATMLMESYIDLQGEQVKSMLEAQEIFKSVTIKEQHSNELEGTIFEQFPRANEEIIAKDTNVEFIVSKGPEPVSLISLLGYNEANRKAYERSSGFKINVSRKEYHATAPVGEVIDQTPSAGTKLKVGDTVNVVVSKGPEAKAEKVSRHEITIPYEPVFEDGIDQLVKQEVVIYIQDKTHSLADPFDTIEITEPTPYSIELTIVEGEKGAYQIRRDNVVIENQTIEYKDVPNN